MEKFLSSKEGKRGLRKSFKELEKERLRFESMNPERKLRELDLHLNSLVNSIKNMKEKGDDNTSIFSMEDLKDMLRILMEARTEIKKKIVYQKSKLPQ